MISKYLKIERLPKREYNPTTKMYGSYRIAGRVTGDCYYIGGRKMLTDILKHQSYCGVTPDIWERYEARMESENEE